MRTKSLIFLGMFAMTLMLFPTNAQAQEKENVVTISLSNLAILTPTIYYERVLGDNISGKMGVFFTGAKISDTKFSGLGLMPEFRYYPGSNGAPRGFYLAPFLKYQNYKLSTDEDESLKLEMSLTGIGGGACIGFQVGRTVVFDMFAGPAITNFSAKFEGSATEDDFSVPMLSTEGGTGIGFRFGMSLGFAF